jgi:hypothetical protein
MNRSAAAAVLAVLVCVPLAPAADKAAVKKPTGVWVKKVNDATVTFTIEDDAMTCELLGGDGNSITAHGAYGVTEDGVLFGIITKVDKKGTNDGPEKGDLFSFQVKVDKDTLTLSDLHTPQDSPRAREIIQGEYKKKK